ncbi:hypothetical protein B2J88_42510 [Rhodococcus sp. SRB_17]|nr:hypothetical protein [Rhodococcus sp. SRB_17]
MSSTRELPTPAKPIVPNKLAHIVFRTRRLQTMIDWYSVVLGAQVVYRAENIAFLTYDDEHHRIALIAGDIAERPDVVSVGFYHAAFTYPDLGDLLATYRRLEQLGITPSRAVKHGATVSLYYRDPDENDIELQVDVYESMDEVNAFLSGDAFKKDPIGPVFDPEQMIEDYESGLPLHWMMRRPDDQPETV